MDVDHRIEITITDEGRGAETGDRLVDALYDLLPTTDAVIDQNLETSLLTATFVVDRGTATDAAKTGIALFERATDRAGMGPSHSVAVSVTARR